MTTQLLFDFKEVYHEIDIENQNVIFYLRSGKYLGQMCLRFKCAIHARGITNAEDLMDIAINNFDNNKKQQ
jgi:hypothetical protein